MKRGTLIWIIIIVIALAVGAYYAFSQKNYGEPQLSPDEGLDVSVTVGTDPYIESITAPPSVNLNAGTTKDETFSFVLVDPMGDIDDSSAIVTLSSGAESIDAMCDVPVPSGPISRTFNCIGSLPYYSTAGPWTMEVDIRSFDQLILLTDSTLFNINLLRDISISPQSLALNVNAGEINILNSITISNNGNFAGAISITGNDLIGQIDGTEMIQANLFRVASSNACSTGAILSTSPISPGTISKGPGASANLDICLTEVPITLSAQTYSSGPWTIEI